MAVCQEFGIDTKDLVASGIAFGFAGGIGSTGSVCGALVGAVMAMGYRSGRGHTMAEGLSRMTLVQELRRRFEVEMGSIACRDLTGMDLTTTEGRAGLMASDVPQRVCDSAVNVACRHAVELLKPSTS